MLQSEKPTVSTELRRMAANRGVWWHVGQEPDSSLKVLMDVASPCMRRHGEAYDEQRKLFHDERDAFFADWNQSPSCGRATPGRLIPTLLTKNYIVSHTKGRRITTEECMGIMGLHVFPKFSKDGKYTSPMPQVFDSEALSDQQRRLLCGNGIHVCAWHAWFLYIMANVERVDNSIEGSLWSVPATSEDSDESDHEHPEKSDHESPTETPTENFPEMVTESDSSSSVCVVEASPKRLRCQTQ